MKSSYKISLIVAAVLCVIVLVYYSGQDSPDQPSGPIATLPEPEAGTSTTAAANSSSQTTAKPAGAGAVTTDKSAEPAGEKNLSNDLKQRLAALRQETPAPAPGSSAAPGSESAASTQPNPIPDTRTPKPDAVPELRLDGHVPAPGSAPTSSATALGSATSTTAAPAGLPGPFDHLRSNTAPTATPPVPPTPAPKPVAASYTIKAGDTFSSIAADKLGDEKYWQQIAQANPTVDPQKLKVGQVIRLPTPGSSDASSTTSDSSSTGKPAYVVKAGDTLSSIADHYYGDSGLWSTIYSANKSKIGSNPDKLKAGMELTIPPAPKGAR